MAGRAARRAKVEVPAAKVAAGGIGGREFAPCCAGPAQRVEHDFGRLEAPPEFGAPEETALQTKLRDEDEVARKVLRPSGSGKAMPDAVRQKMEGSFGQDLSGVRIHEGPEARSIGAIAYTRGADIHFAPGAYSPSSGSGQRLLGHELAHVVQQREGRVAAPAGARIPINDDPGLEREADRLAARAARG